MLPQLPEARFVVEEERPIGEPGFLQVRRYVLRVQGRGGSISEPFVYDVVDRSRLDAVVIAAHYRSDGTPHVFLRSCLRPPPALRPADAQALPEKASVGQLWELPAGLVEVDERSPSGLSRCAARELEEELGFAVPPDALSPLGPSTFPAPAMIAERHFFFHVEVDPKARGAPTEDGSVLERGARIVALPLADAIDLTRTGAIEDGKTELALRRLAEWYAGGDRP